MLLKGNDQLEDSMLRSILLFNDKKRISSSRDMLLKAIFSIITFGGGKYGTKEINEILKRRFSLDLTEYDLNKQIEKLKEKKLVIVDETDRFQAITNNYESKVFYETIETETTSLIEGIIDRVKHEPHIMFSGHDLLIAKNNICQALSVYYRMYGYSFFGLKEEAETNEILNAVETVRKGLPETFGKALVGAMADVIDRPTPQEKNILEKWARAFVAMQVINLDPSLRNFKATKLRGKSFVIDTDFALYALTNNAKLSQAYKTLINFLIGHKCHIYIPSIVVEEIVSHIEAANKRFFFDGTMWSSMTDEILETQVANVFVEDYVKSIRTEKKSGMSFDVYLRNFYAPDTPLLNNKLKEVFGDFELIEKLEPLDDDVKRVFANNIKYRTQNSVKGARRDDEKNTKIAEADASLYLTLKKMNKDEHGNDKPLNQKVYLLTKSHKTIKCAKEVGIYERNIVCDPLALLTILQEMGVFSEEIKLINLFENPFLTYTAELIWNEVAPLLNEGIHLKHVEIHKLRIDVDANIDRILTCETLEERAKEAERLSKRGYFFANDLLEVREELNQKDWELQERDTVILSQHQEIERLKAELNSKEQEHRKKLYLGRINKKRKK